MGDPHVWKVVDGRLYPNLDADIMEIRSKGVSRHIEKADRKWPALRDRDPASLLCPRPTAAAASLPSAPPSLFVSPSFRRRPMTLLSRSPFLLAILATLAAIFTLGELGSTPAVAASKSAPTLDGFRRFVDEDGRFRFSRAATEGMVHLGSWFVPTGDNAGFHHVYTQPETVAAFRSTGRFPDGAALVKEIVRHRRADYTTGADVASATSTVQWFLMVKDAEGRFDGNPLWGDGWGWALFRGDDPAKNVATDYRADCLGCHAPARPRDWVYTEGYPGLANP
ncbi:MAG: cytochrome P460 family protein [Myxococcota bacterium]